MANAALSGASPAALKQFLGVSIGLLRCISIYIYILYIYIYLHSIPILIGHLVSNVARQTDIRTTRLLQASSHDSSSIDPNIAPRLEKLQKRREQREREHWAVEKQVVRLPASSGAPPAIELEALPLQTVEGLLLRS